MLWKIWQLIVHWYSYTHDRNCFLNVWLIYKFATSAIWCFWLKISSLTVSLNYIINGFEVYNVSSVLKPYWFSFSVYNIGHIGDLSIFHICPVSFNLIWIYSKLSWTQFQFNYTTEYNALMNSSQSFIVGFLVFSMILYNKFSSFCYYNAGINKIYTGQVIWP
jgi:hypothetical protein